jgi:hypothetical protein
MGWPAERLSTPDRRSSAPDGESFGREIPGAARRVYGCWRPTQLSSSRTPTSGPISTRPSSHTSTTSLSGRTRRTTFSGCSIPWWWQLGTEVAGQEERRESCRRSADAQASLPTSSSPGVPAHSTGSPSCACMRKGSIPPPPPPFACLLRPDPSTPLA